jgi:hypothetical protein
VTQCCFEQAQGDPKSGGKGGGQRGLLQGPDRVVGGDLPLQWHRSPSHGSRLRWWSVERGDQCLGVGVHTSRQLIGPPRLLRDHATSLRGVVSFFIYIMSLIFF